MLIRFAVLVVVAAAFASSAGRAAASQAGSGVVSQLTPAPLLPAPSAITISVAVDRGEGGTYYVGDPIRICMTVSGSATVRLTDILPTGTSNVTFNERVSGQRCIHSFITPPLGLETVRADALEDVVCIMAPCPPLVMASAQTYFYVLGEPWAPPPPWPPFPSPTLPRPPPSPTPLPTATATLVPTPTAAPPTPTPAPPPSADPFLLSGPLCGTVDCEAVNLALGAIAPGLSAEEADRLRLHFQAAEAAWGLYGAESEEFASAMRGLRDYLAYLAERLLSPLLDLINLVR